MEITSEIFHALALRSCPGIGDVTAKEIIKIIGSPKQLFSSNKEDLRDLLGSREWAEKIFKQKDEVFKKAEKIMEDCQKNNISIKFYFDEDFPKRLYYLNDAPFLIYFKGEKCWDNEYSLGIVGTRRPDGYGVKITGAFVDSLREYNPLIVSGMALGIDGYAHYHAIKNHLKTIGVMGHGLDMVYPSNHKKLAREILDAGGMLMSEFPPGTLPEPQHFPRRNRIVAGISDALLVVQSRMKGGSMITATIAHSYNKDVFAVPGPVDEPLSEGPNGLIKMNKACLVENGKDIAFFMNWKCKNNCKKTEICKETETQTSLPLSEEDEIFIKLRFKKRKWLLDEIMQELNMPYSKVAQNITRLELNGQLIRHPGSVLEFL